MEVRFEVMHVYLAQYCFFLPLPHMLLEVKMLLPPAKNQKTGLHKENTDLQTLD